MARKKIFSPGEYYHIYSRTILNIPEFKNKKNASRLAEAFLLANSTESTKAFMHLRNYSSGISEKVLDILQQGERLVDILSFVIMPDHYHLLLREKKKNSITDFIRKCNTSIAKYINIKENRKGPLFESRFKAKHVDSNEYLLHLSLYIHLNPLDFLDSKDWRKGNLKNWQSKEKKLLDYPWSSLKSFVDNNHEDLIISGAEIILDQFDNKDEYKRFLQRWSECRLSELDSLIIE